jgi:hypothetical protein
MSAPNITEQLLTDSGIDQHFWSDPNDVLNDPVMSIAAKRAVLASWASDARAVPDHPALRQLESGAIVDIDSVLAALKRLDGVGDLPPAEKNDRWARKGHWSRLGRRWRRFSRDDDDDDPFSPAPAMRPPRLPALDGAASAAA